MKTSRPRILCVGAVHWDMIARSTASLQIGDDLPGTVHRRPGGVAANVALAFAAAGCPTALCSSVGDDAPGQTLIRELQAKGINCARVIRIKGASTGHYLAIEDHHGDLFAAIADAAVLDENPDKIVNQTTLAIQSAETIFMDANLATSALHEIADTASNAGLQIIANPVSPAKAPRLAFLLSGEHDATIVCNLAETNVLLNASHADAEAAAIALQNHVQGTALVTNGAHPVALATPDHVTSQTPPQLTGTTSVTGAGDALLAAFLIAQSRSYAPDAALRFALQAATQHMKVGTHR